MVSEARRQSCRIEPLTTGVYINLVNVTILLNCRTPSCVRELVSVEWKPHIWCQKWSMSVLHCTLELANYPRRILACAMFWLNFMNSSFFQDHDPSNSDCHRSCLQMTSKIYFFSILYSSGIPQWVNSFGMSYPRRNKSGSIKCLWVKDTAKKPFYQKNWG